MLEARLDSLRHFLEVIVLAVHKRFYVPGDKGDAFVRTLTFQAKKSQLDALRDDVYRMLEERVFAADAECEGTDAPIASVSFVVTRSSADARLRS